MVESVYLVNARVVAPSSIWGDHCVVLRGHRIVWVGPMATVQVPSDARVVDVGGSLLGPGFIDLHCHGGGGAWFHDEPEVAAAYHLAHGTTSLLATTVLHPERDEQVAAVATIGTALAEERLPNVVGIHMEGPYLHPDLGAYKQYSRLPHPDEYLDFVEAGQGHLRWMTIAPEVEGVPEMVASLQLATGGAMTFSVGHSKATPEDIRSLLASGLRMATHLTNASGCAHEPSRYAGTKEVGVDEAVLLEQGIVAEVVVDRDGRHVRPDWLRLIHQIKGVDGVVLVTDATAESGRGPDGEVSDVNYNATGGLAGSSLTMDRAVSNYVRQTGAPLVDAWRMASLTPARCLRQGDVGIIEPGARADLVIADHDTEAGLTIRSVWLSGTEQEIKR